VTAPEYAFVASQRASERARGAVLALKSLGYDARGYGADSAEARRAKAVVFCDVAPDVERFIYDVSSLDGIEAARDAFAVTAPSAELAGAAAARLGREVEVVHEPVEGVRAAPRAARVRPRSRPLEWLARRAGLETEVWRPRLLWIGEKSDIETIVGAYPELKALGAKLPLALQCLAAPETLDALLERIQEDAPEAVRLAFAATSAKALARALDECDFVLLPGSARLEREVLHAGRLAITGADPCEAIRQALAQPRAALERLQRAQRELDEAYAPAVVARAWVRILMKGRR
jgi:hypothetical protein